MNELMNGLLTIKKQRKMKNEEKKRSRKMELIGIEKGQKNNEMHFEQQ